MDYNFDFNIDTSGMIKVSIMRLGIIFNSETIKVLGFPAKINIGFDSRNKVLGIKASDGDPSIKEYDFAKKGNEKWIRVNSRVLVQTIKSAVKGLDVGDKAKPFPARFDKESKMLIVELGNKK